MTPDTDYAVDAYWHTDAEMDAVLRITDFALGADL